MNLKNKTDKQLLDMLVEYTILQGDPKLKGNKALDNHRHEVHQEIIRREAEKEARRQFEGG